MNNQRDHGVDLSALFGPSLMLMGLMIGYLKYHAYPLLNPEAIIALVAVAVIGALFGLLPALLGPTRLRAFILGLLLLFLLDLQFGSDASVRNLVTGDHDFPRWVFYTIVFAAAFVAFLAILSMREHIAVIFVTISGVFFLSALIVPSPSLKFGGEEVATSNVHPSSDPPIIHLILDGHIGIEGIPLNLPGGLETRTALLRFYEKWGFRLFGGAYSPYLMTLNSVGNFLNGAASDQDMVHLEDGPRDRRGNGLINNRYFETVLQSKRNIRVFQSDWFDYCDNAQAPVEFCFTYPATSINAVEGAGLPALAKARFVLDNFFRRDNLSGKLYKFFVSRPYYSTIAVPEVFSTLREDILTNPRGKLFFGHLMLPHDPYIWDRRCRMRPDASQWMTRRPNQEDLRALGTPEYREKAYADYFDQVLCVVQLLDDLLISIDRAGLLRDATVIFHGDHGSRITTRDPIIPYRDQATKSDYVASFSTLFAIRSPELEAGYSSELRPLPNLFAEYLLRLPAPMDDQTLYLRNDHKLEGLDLMPVRMPDF